MTNPPEMTSPEAGVPGPLAEWADRVIATLIDFAFILVAAVALFIVSAIIGAISDALAALVSILGYLVLSVYGLYLGFLEGTRGQSPGKAIRGLKVVKASDGELLGGGMGVVRKIAHIVDGIICYLGYLLPLFDAKKQTVADKIVDTVVLKDQETKPLSQALFMP